MKHLCDLEKVYTPIRSFIKRDEVLVYCLVRNYWRKLQNKLKTNE